MFRGLLSNIKWFLLAAGVIGPFLGYTSMQDLSRYDALKESGVNTQAYIEGATETERRKRGRTRGSSYSLDLVWLDASGAERRAKSVGITSDLANRVIKNNEIVMNELPILYMESDASVEPAIVQDMPKQVDQAGFMRTAGFVGGGIGILGFLAVMFMRRRS